jgi:type I restriction enzyme S subunit
MTTKYKPYPVYKDSGVEWLGEVPGHWKISQLRRYILFITSGSRGWAEYYADSGSIFIRIGNLTRDSINIDLTDVQYVQPPTGSEGERTVIREGDILFSITAYLGSVAVAGQEIEGAYVSQHVALVRINTSLIYPRFIAYMILSDGGKNQLQGSAYGGTKVQLALDDVREIWILLPFIEEQKAIATFLDGETAKIDTLIQKSCHAIDILKERRTALISAAVTGKIDVRDSA